MQLLQCPAELHLHTHLPHRGADQEAHTGWKTQSSHGVYHLVLIPASISVSSAVTYFCSKIRRVKCDEATLSCKRCTSTGRKCHGYALRSKPHADADALGMVPVTQQSKFTVPAGATTILRPLVADIPGNHTE